MPLTWRRNGGVRAGDWTAGDFRAWDTTPGKAGFRKWALDRGGERVGEYSKRIHAMNAAEWIAAKEDGNGDHEHHGSGKGGADAAA